MRRVAKTAAQPVRRLTLRRQKEKQLLIQVNRGITSMRSRDNGLMPNSVH